MEDANSEKANAAFVQHMTPVEPIAGLVNAFIYGTTVETVRPARNFTPRRPVSCRRSCPYRTAAHRVAAVTRWRNSVVTQRTQRETTLLISRSQSTELAIAAQNTQSRGLKLTVPNAR